MQVKIFVQSELRLPSSFEHVLNQWLFETKAQVKFVFHSVDKEGLAIITIFYEGQQ